MKNGPQTTIFVPTPNQPKAQDSLLTRIHHLVSGWITDGDEISRRLEDARTAHQQSHLFSRFL